jgi:hypothetical protein
MKAAVMVQEIRVEANELTGFIVAEFFYTLATKNKAIKISLQTVEIINST